ncbi:MAG TPA: thioredoxin domain-containing protein, partial [Gammaproteobacteria bacterium]
LSAAKISAMKVDRDSANDKTGRLHQSSYSSRTHFMSEKNHLAAETSLYLQQHADNPVDWHPWGEQALELARRENKPILLSIGYSACHWCHVMAHESFEDAETAALMNQLFINIKVDREERPDLDKIYQLAHYAIAQRGGGWPLTMFLTPEQIPIFGGTYFPKEPRYGLPSFKDILRRVSQYMQENPAELRQQSESVARFLHNLQHTAQPARQAAGAHLFKPANDGLLEWFDADNGGFGGAPKFPHSISLNYALRQWYRVKSNNSGDAAVLLRMVTHSLDSMARGGVYDQLGGGFFRYAVDAQWQTPHFEKMLYDNALLLDLYVSAWQAQPSPLYARVIAETASWVIYQMNSPKGAFYSTLDADSEGIEGKYYAWDREEIKSLLGEAYPLFAKTYGLDKPPNFEDHWHLHISGEPAVGADTDEAVRRLETARNLLLSERYQRIAPGRDEKILTSWNSLMIKALFRAGQALQQQDWIDAAEDALAFLRNTVWSNEQLYAVYSGGHARFAAYLDDYAFLLDAVMQALQCRWRSEDFEFALSIADNLVDHFEDSENGGFYFTADNHESLIYRPKPRNDESTPSGGAVAAFALQRLAQLTDNTRYSESAARALQAATHEMEAAPSEHCGFLTALEEYLHPPDRIILRGDAEELQEWQVRIAEIYLPSTAVYAIDSSTVPPPSLMQPAPDAGVTAYICQGVTCSAPISDLQELIETLKK